MNLAMRDHEGKETETERSLYLIRSLSLRESGSREVVYKRLADGISGLIEKGQLAPDTQLPTVRELAASLRLSPGTVKHAYNLLEQQGYLFLCQGRGSFVRPRPEKEPELSRKEQAVLAIDRLLNELDALQLSRRQIQIFLDLKLRERDELGSKLKVLLLSESPEERSFMQSVLSRLPACDYYVHPVEDLLFGRIRAEDYGALVCTTEVYRALRHRLQTEELPILPFGMALSPDSLIELSRLQPETRLGILSLSRTFGGKMAESCSAYANLRQRPRRALFSESAPAAFLRGLDALLLPADYFSYLNEELRRDFREFERRGGILLSYRLREEEASLAAIREVLEEAVESQQPELDS